MPPTVRGGCHRPNMRLSFDQNLSFMFCQTIADLFPDSNHTKPLGLSEVADRELRNYAKANGFTIVSQNADFAEMAALLGSPPKVIWLRAGNQSTDEIVILLSRHAELTMTFGDGADAACLEIY